MATETDAKGAKPAESWEKKQSFVKFLRDIVIVGVILGGGLWVYKQHVDKGKQVRELGKEAKILMLKDNPAEYAAAETKLKQIIELDATQPFAVSSLALLYGIRWNDFGVDSDAANSREWSQKADALDARIAERYGAVMLAKLGDKKWAEADAYGTELSTRAATGAIVNGIGRATRAEGKLDMANQAFKKAADTDWRNPRFACDFADLYLENGDFVNAESFYVKGIESNSEHLRSLIGRARAQIGRGLHIKDAEQALEQAQANGALESSPKLKAQAKVGLAELRMLEQKFDEALKLADEAIAAYGSFPWGHHVRGRALAATRDAAGAAASFDKALELDPNAPQFYYVASAALLEAGDSAKAASLLDAYTARLKEDDRLHITYAALLRKAGKPDEALGRYEKVLETSSNAQAYLGKAALMLEDKKNFDEARKALEAALTVQEMFPKAHETMGDLLFEMKEYVDGCQSYATALTQMKLFQVPREKLNALREGVGEKLNKAGKKDVAKLWLTESSNLIR